MGLGKVMAKYASEDARGRAPSYPRAMAAALPYALVQSAGDVPKGAVERSVEDAVAGRRPEFSRAFKLGRSKAAGRFAAAAFTTPLFLSGMKDLKEAKTPEQRRKGSLKVLGAGAGFGAIKGTVETALDKGVKSKDIGKSLRGALLGRGLYGAVGGLLTARAVAENLRPHKGTRTLGEKAKPYAIAGGLAAAEGFTESALQKGLTSKGALRAAVAKSTGRAAGGMIGAALISAIAGHAGQEKKAEAAQAASPYDAYVSSRNWAAQAPPADIRKHVEGLQSQGPLTPYRRAAVAGLVDGGMGRPARSVSPPGVVDAGILALAVSSPHLVLGVLDQMDPSQRDLLLRDAMDRIAAEEAVSLRDAVVGDERSIGKAIYVNRKTHAAVVGHEIGHAVAGDLRKATIASEASNLAHTWASGAAGVIPLVVLLSTTERDFATPEDYEARATFLSRVGKIAALTASPKLLEEGLASSAAVRYLLRAGASRNEAAAHALTRLLPSFATYAAPLALPFLAANRFRAKGEKLRQETA